MKSKPQELEVVEIQQLTEEKRMTNEYNLNVIRSIQELLYRETHYGSYPKVSNRLGLNEDEQQQIKNKLLEYINKL